MSVSRRNFTKEFKEAAVRRLELGASLAEVARACEVNLEWAPFLRQPVSRNSSGNFL